MENIPLPVQMQPKQLIHVLINPVVVQKLFNLMVLQRDIEMIAPQQ